MEREGEEKTYRWLLVQKYKYKRQKQDMIHNNMYIIAQIIVGIFFKSIHTYSSTFPISTHTHTHDIILKVNACVRKETDWHEIIKESQKAVSGGL